MKLGPLPETHWTWAFTASERTGSGLSPRENALDPGFHCVPAGPAHPSRVLMVPGGLSPGFQARAARLRAH